MKPGLYALASLEGSPLQPAVLQRLGLNGAEVERAPGCALRAFDYPSVLPSLHIARTPDALTAFAGFLDEPDELAAALRLPATASAAELASAALVRFGADAPLRMLGEWSTLHWSVPDRQLTLLGSLGTRDPLCWTMLEGQLAVAPDPLLLASLQSGGPRLDREGLALSLARAAVRQNRGNATAWQGVSVAEAGVRETFSAGVRRSCPPTPEAEPQLWRGTFDEAVEALDHLGKRIVFQGMQRYGEVAFLLSGGLDSTLLAALGAQQRGAATRIVSLTSTAPEGSGLPDECAWSHATAAHLGLPIDDVCPSGDADPFRPLVRNFLFEGGPVPMSRHYLYDALWAAAAGRGAAAVFDGVLGELSITAKPQPGQQADWLRRLLYRARDWEARVKRRRGWPAESFHVRFTPELLGNLPPAWEQLWRRGMPAPHRGRASRPRGFDPAIQKSAGVETATGYGLRRLLPFRDRRLLRFAAGLPSEFGEHRGVTRALARAMLRGQVPEEVRLRTRGLPFSPDFTLRMHAKADAARARLPLFREAGVGRWLDLNWLDAALERLSAGANPYAREQAQAQLSSMAGEFFFWVAAQGVVL